MLARSLLFNVARWLQFISQSRLKPIAQYRVTVLAGYSRLMGADEEGTHERLKAHLVELVDPKIGRLRPVRIAD
jgi:hypothetical protein